jgi:hypothetical protein
MNRWNDFYIDLFVLCCVLVLILIDDDWMERLVHRF